MHLGQERIITAHGPVIPPTPRRKGHFAQQVESPGERAVRRPADAQRVLRCVRRPIGFRAADSVLC